MAVPTQSYEDLAMLAPLTEVVVIRKTTKTDRGNITLYYIEDNEGTALFKNGHPKFFDIARLCKICRAKVYRKKVHLNYDLEQGTQLCDACLQQADYQVKETGFGVELLRWWYGKTGQMSLNIQNFEGKTLLHLIGSQHVVLHGWGSKFVRMIVNMQDNRLGDITEERNMLGFTKNSFTISGTSGSIIKPVDPVWGKFPFYRVTTPLLAYRILASGDSSELGSIYVDSSMDSDGFEARAWRTTFPKDMPVQQKALLLGATILMDYKYSTSQL